MSFVLESMDWVLYPWLVQTAEKDLKHSLNPVTQECMQKHPKDGLHHTPGAGYFNNISKYFVHTSTALPN